MSMNCPRCGSHRLNPHAPGRRVGSRLGALCGASLALINMTRAAPAATSLALIGGPLTGFGAVLLAALFAGSAGGALGGALGKLADQNFLNDHKCLDCGFAFRADGDEEAPAAVFRVHPEGPTRPRFFAGADHLYPEEQ